MIRQNSSTRFLAVSLSAIVLTFLLTASLQAQTTQTLYMPVLQATDAGDIGLALSNPTLTQTTVTLTARDYNGSTISGTGITNPATITLPPSGQRALRAVEIFGTGLTGKVGWVEMQASSVATKGFFLVFDSRVSFIDGAELQARPVSRIVFPKVSGNPASPTTISYVHTGADTVGIAALSFYENGGRLAARTFVTLRPRSGFSGPITDLLPDAAGLEGYAVLETAGTPFSTRVESLIGFETYKNKTDVAALNAISDSTPVRIGYLPHFANGGGYTTRLSLINYTADSQIIKITADSLEGQAAVSVNRTLAPFARLEESAESLFSLTGTALKTGYIKWETQGSTRGVLGYLDYGTTDGVLLSAVPAQSTSYSDLFFSHIAEGLGYYTGVAFLNANTQSTVVNIDAFDKDGAKVASTSVTLAAGERRSRIFNELFPALTTQLGGYVRVSASRPIFAFELFGSRSSLSFLANVAAQGVQLQPQSSGRVVRADTGANVISAEASSSISIPPGALTSDVAVSLNSVTVTLPPPTSTQQVVASVDAQPSGTKFNIPVRLTFPLSVQLPPGTQIPLLVYTAAGTYDGSDGFIAIVDDSGRTASAQVTHFTTFALGLNSDQLINVTALSPTSGASGTSVTITGTGFGANAADNIVTFAGPENSSVAAEVTSATATSLVVKVPAGAVTGDVIVKVGAKTSKGIRFTVPVARPKPSLSAITPTSFTAGTTTAELSVIGTSFDRTSVVRVDGVAVETTTYIDATLLLATVSGSQVAPGVRKVTVYTAPDPSAGGGGESSSAEFTVGYPVPTITSISPTSFPSLNGPVTVTIKGTNFTPASKVLVNGFDGNGKYVDGSTMTVSLTSEKAVPLPLQVSNPSPGGGVSGTIVFNFGDPPVGSIVVISASGQSGTVATTKSLEVELRKVDNSILPNFGVNFAITAGNGSVPSSATTNTSGRATVTVTLGTTAGTNTVTISAGNVTTTFSVTGTPDVAAKVGVTAAPTSIQAGGSGSTITAKIQDQYGNTRTADTLGITFSVSSGSGTLSVTSANAVAGVLTSIFTSVTTGSNTIQAASAGLTTGSASVGVTPGAPASLTATAGTGQNGQAGVALATALKVQVKDAFGNVVPGVTVTFSVVSGGGSVSPTSAVTNSNGEASTTATAGGALGTQTFRAASTGLTNVDINATIAPGPATKLALSTGGVTTLVAGTTANLTVTIQDQFGNTNTSANNTITITSNITGSPIGAVVGPTSGVATSTFSGQLVGSYTLTASSTGLTSATANISVTAGAAAALAYVSGDGQSGVKNTQLPGALIVKVTDVFGNAVSGVGVTFAATAGGGSVGTANATSGTNGQASSTATLGNALGTNTYTATSGTLTGSPVTFTATAINAPPASIAQVGSSTSPDTVAKTQTFTVVVKDAGSNVLSGVAVAFAKTAGNGSVSANSVITDSNGQAAVTVTLGTQAGTNTFTATVTGLTAVTINITGTADTATQMIYISGDTQTGNTGTNLAAPLVVEVRDQYNNPKSGVAVTFAALSGSGTVTPSGANNTGTDGRASVTARLGLEVGTQTFRATSTGLPSVTFSATVNQAPATTLAQSGTITIVTVGSSGTFSVIAKDANANGVPGVTVAFAKTAGAGSITPASVVTGANGVASATYTLSTTAGTNTFTATSGTLTGSPVTANITGVADAAATLTKVAGGDNQTGGVGAQLANPLVVEAKDVYGNLKSGLAVTLAATSGSGTTIAPAATVNTGTDGRASFNVTLGSAVGGYQFTATATGVPPVTFTATGTLIPANVTKTAGDNQTVAPSISLLTPLKVHVTNSGGVAIPNVTVNWAVASGGGSVGAATSLTDSNGDATMTATVGSSTGTNTFTATVSGLTPVTFTATAKTLASTPTSVTVNIASGSTLVGSYQVTITYDKNLVTLSSSNVTGGNGAGFTGTPTTVNIDNTAGTVTINHFQTGNTPSGNFTVATLTFTPIRAGTVTLATAPSGSPTTVTNTLGQDVSASFLSLSATSLTIN